jgi:hypothetical protein
MGQDRDPTHRLALPCSALLCPALPCSGLPCLPCLPRWPCVRLRLREMLARCRELWLMQVREMRFTSRAAQRSAASTQCAGRQVVMMMASRNCSRPPFFLPPPVRSWRRYALLSLATHVHTAHAILRSLDNQCDFPFSLESQSSMEAEVPTIENAALAL